MAQATVLHVGPMPPPVDGGIAAYVHGMLRSPLVTEFPAEPFDVRVGDVYRRSRMRRAGLGLRFVRRYRRRLGRTHASLVHIHATAYLGFWEKSVLAWLSARRGLPYVLHIHGGNFDRFMLDMPAWQRRIAARVFGAAAGVIILSRAWRPLFEGWVASERLHVVPNAIHVADFAAATPGDDTQPVRIVFTGMISARKGLDELCQALATLRAAGAVFHVDIVGDEEVLGEAAHYREVFRQAGLDAVHFHGLLGSDAIVDLLQRAHVFVLPSRSESFGIANLEAMASGLPVVSTRTGAIPEYITDGVHGHLVEPGDAAGLTQALQRVMDSAELRARLGSAAREQAHRYDWSNVSSQIESIYRSILS